jgi:hypothetical protein
VTSRFASLWPIAPRYVDLLLILCVALGFRLLWASSFVLAGVAIEPDGAHYARLAENVLHSRGYVGMTPDAAEIFAPPVFPALIALASGLLPSSLSLESVARLVSALMGALLVVPIYLLASTHYGRQAAVVAGIAVAAHPVLGQLSGMALADSTYLTLLFAGAYCAIHSLHSASQSHVCLAGALFALACLTSLAAVPSVILIAIIYIVSAESRRTGMLKSALFLAIVTITVVPAILVLAFRTEATQFPLTSSAVVGFRLRDGLTALQAFGFPAVVILAALGLYARRRGSNSSAQLVLMAIVVGHAIVLSAALVPVRFVTVLLPVMLIWAGNGACELGRWVSSFVSAPNRRRWVTIGTPAVALAVVLLLSCRHVRALDLAESGPWRTPLIKQIGRWVERAGVENPRLMDTLPDLAFYAGGDLVPFPEMGSEALLTYIDRHRPDFIVVRDTLATGRPRLRHWVTEGVPDRRALLVYGEKPTATGQQVLVYRWTRDEKGPQAAGLRLSENSFATGPLRVHPLNPRYFSDAAGRIVYLTGAHTWSNLQDADRFEPADEFDFDSYLSFLRAHNHNFIRLWTWEQANWVSFRPYDYRFSPIPYARVGPGLALDGKPKFDLASFDAAYFERLRDRVVEAGERGIYVSIMLFQGWSVIRHSPADEWENPWQGHPFNAANNVNGIDGDPDRSGDGIEIHTLDDPRIRTLQEAYIERVVDAVNDLDNVLFEVCNECRHSSIEWQYHIVRFIHGLESRRPKQHPVGMTGIWPPATNSDLFRGPADWVSPNGENVYTTDPPASDGRKVILTDTDHIWGLGGDIDWVWKSFLRGLNPIFMDPYDHAWMLPRGDFPAMFAGDRQWNRVRVNMGHTATFAARMDLASMVPRGDLSSTGYCLARVGGPRPEYLTFSPWNVPIRLDLTGAPGEMNAEWFRPATGTYEGGGSISGGEVRTFTSPFPDETVLRVYSSH